MTTFAAAKSEMNDVAGGFSLASPPLLPCIARGDRPDQAMEAVEAAGLKARRQNTKISEHNERLRVGKSAPERVTRRRSTRAGQSTMTRCFVGRVR